MQLKYKYYYNFEKLFLFLFFIILFFPKIDLIEIPNYWQGIRLEDIALTIYGLTVLFNYEEKIINNEQVKKFVPVLFYFVIIFIAAFVGKMSGLQIKYLSLIRILEYFFIVILLCNIKISKEDIVYYLKIYVLVNIVFSVLQEFSLIGAFTSLGYLDPDHELNARSMGITGGSWELGVIISLCYFIILRLEKPNYFRTFIYFIIVLLLNIIAESRGNFIGFFIANIFLLKNHLSTKKYLSSIFGILILAVISIYGLETLNSKAYKRIIETDYFFAFQMVKDYVFFQELPTFDQVGFSSYSLVYRLNLWDRLLTLYIDNFFTILFGSGTTAIYYESGIIRIIFTTGLIGLIYTAFMARKLEMYILIYFILIGLTLDIFNSLKIFSFTMLYYKLIYENYSNRRN